MLHSIFNQIDVFLNQKLVSPPNNAYPYRAYIESLLNYSPIEKESHLTAGLWYDDTAGLFEAQPQVRGELANKGALNRQHFTLNGKIFVMIGHLHCDVFNQEYGLAPVSRHHIDRLRRNYASFKWNEKKLQSVNSKVCGKYCIMFLCYICSGCTLRAFCNIFSRDSYVNDALAAKFYENIE